MVEVDIISVTLFADAKQTAHSSPHPLLMQKSHPSGTSVTAASRLAV
jgi:hypothetical protein